MQLFEDSQVEKEVDIRRRVLRDFNKKEEDFASLREYNDYLEEVETIIFNLVNNIDQLETNKKIEKFKKENRELILKNKARVRPSSSPYSSSHLQCPLLQLCYNVSAFSFSGWKRRS